MQTAEDFLKSPQAASLKGAWQGAVAKIQSEPTPGKFPLFQVNFRVNLLEALKATWESAEVAIKITVAAHGVFDPVTWAGIGLETISAVRSVISSLVQTMQPIDYVTYVILSRTPEGIERSALKKSIEEFLAKPKSTKFAWYLGMTEGLLNRAKEVADPVESPGWLDEVIGRLAAKNMVEVSQSRVVFRPRNFTIGWESE